MRVEDFVCWSSSSLWRKALSHPKSSGWYLRRKMLTCRISLTTSAKINKILWFCVYLAPESARSISCKLKCAMYIYLDAIDKRDAFFAWLSVFNQYYLPILQILIPNRPNKTPSSIPNIRTMSGNYLMAEDRRYFRPFIVLNWDPCSDGYRPDNGKPMRGILSGRWYSSGGWW